MNGFKEFQGKDLDSAINDACDYFNLVREKLEIEILQDSKSGIFGIVGARKAKIRARRVQLPESLKTFLEKTAKGEEKTASVPQTDAENSLEKAQTGGNAARAGRTPSASVGKGRRNAGKNGNGVKKEMPARTDMQEHPQNSQESAEDGLSRGEREFSEEDMDDASQGTPQTPLEELDVDRLKALVAEIATKIICVILGEKPTVAVEVCRDRVRVKVDCSQDSGLLIGREGQTLGSVQYLLSRMISRDLGTAVRIQMDAGDYRRRQEDKLKNLAFALAEKARRSGRTISTHPLSSYHRRIVHLSLQDVPDIQTRSIGEGPMKRVSIQRRTLEN